MEIVSSMFSIASIGCPAEILPIIGISRTDFIFFIKDMPRVEFLDFRIYPLALRESICSWIVETA